jgi:hypothetical protein
MYIMGAQWLWLSMVLTRCGHSPYMDVRAR